MLVLEEEESKVWDTASLHSASVLLMLCSDAIYLVNKFCLGLLKCSCK